MKEWLTGNSAGSGSSAQRELRPSRFGEDHCVSEWVSENQRRTHNGGAGHERQDSQFGEGSEQSNGCWDGSTHNSIGDGPKRSIMRMSECSMVAEGVVAHSDFRFTKLPISLGISGDSGKSVPTNDLINKSQLKRVHSTYEQQFQDNLEGEVWLTVMSGATADQYELEFHSKMWQCHWWDYQIGWMIGWHFVLSWDTMMHMRTHIVNVSAIEYEWSMVTLHL